MNKKKKEHANFGKKIHLNDIFGSGLVSFRALFGYSGEDELGRGRNVWIARFDEHLDRLHTARRSFRV